MVCIQEWKGMLSLRTLSYSLIIFQLHRVETLLAKGIDCNTVDDEDGRTALHWAVRNNHFDIAKALTLAGSSVNIADKVSACDEREREKRKKMLIKKRSSNKNTIITLII